VEGAVITAKVNNTTVLDEDGILVARISDKDTQTVTVTASKEGYQSTTKVLTLTGLTCESAPA
jgi:hypothetical protein